MGTLVLMIGSVGYCVVAICMIFVIIGMIMDYYKALNSKSTPYAFRWYSKASGTKIFFHWVLIFLLSILAIGLWPITLYIKARYENQ